jgi:hypothetical protein
LWANANQNNPDGASAVANERMSSHANLLWSLVANMDLGIEYM